MAPAGSYEALMAAIKAGANSVYFGIEQLNMRARSSNNFTLEDLKKIARICKENKITAYLTVNTILYDHDLTLMKKIVDAAKEAKIDAIIASDIAAIRYANSAGMPVHISTQANVCNIEAVKFFAKFADVIVLARELTLSQVKEICNEVKKQDILGFSGKSLRIEIFAHGALCVAVSGKCYMSLGVYNASANRGACLQNCRRSYRVIDEETGDELVLDNKYVMSPKDLCTIKFLDKILGAGVSVLKIEGRGRGPEYVYTVTKAYREAADSVLEGTYTKERIDSWMKQLGTVYNRGFWEGGYYLGKKLGEWSGSYGSKATKEKVYLGKVLNYYQKNNVGHFILEAGTLKVGDEIIITGPTTGIVEMKAGSIFVDDKKVVCGKKGEEITIPIVEHIRPNDKLFVMVQRHA